MATRSPSDLTMPVADDPARGFLASPPKEVSSRLVELMTRMVETAGDPLRRKKTRIETVLDAAPVLVFLLDGTGKIFLDNQEYKRLKSDLRGREPLDVLRQALVGQAAFDPLEVVRSGHSFKDVEVGIEIPGTQGGVQGSSAGPRWFSCSGTPAGEAETCSGGRFGQQKEGDQCLLFLANDITIRRREVERAYLENLRARLAEQEMTHGMREALGAAIYQMQGPLNVIGAAIDMLERGNTDPTTLAHMLTQISASGHQAMTTLKAALPEEAEEAEVPLNVNELLRQVLEIETDRLLAAGIVVEWQPAYVLPRLTGHENQLRSMFKQLIENAVLALNENSETHRVLRLSTRACDGTVEVDIQDNGPGIAPAERLRVFEPFYIGWRNRRGRAGMGLAMSQEIVNRHGGWIEVDPECKTGCRIRLSLNAVVADE